MVAAISIVRGITIRIKKSNNFQKSRPQQALWSFDLMLTCLSVLTSIFFILTIYSILQTNSELFNLRETRWLYIKILDTSTSATLFVTLLGALLVRHQFALGILPRINYTSAITTKHDTRNTNVSFETWRVEIRNTGLGSAIINHSEYLIELSIANETKSKSFADIIVELGKIDLVHGKDYWLGKMSSGFSLSPKDEFLVFEIKTEHIPKLNRLDMTLYFQGQLGDKYLREIRFIPGS